MSPTRSASSPAGASAAASAPAVEPIRAALAEPLRAASPGMRQVLASRAATGHVERALAGAVDRAVASRGREVPSSRIWPFLGLLQTITTLSIGVTAIWVALWVFGELFLGPFAAWNPPRRVIRSGRPGWPPRPVPRRPIVPLSGRPDPPLSPATRGPAGCGDRGHREGGDVGRFRRADMARSAGTAPGGADQPGLPLRVTLLGGFHVEAR